MWLGPDPGAVHDVDLVVGVGRMPFFAEYRNLFQTDAQELGRLRFAVLIMVVCVCVASEIKFPTLPALVDKNGVSFLVSLDHALEVKVLCEACRALICFVGHDHGSAETAWDFVHGVAYCRHVQCERFNVQSVLDR